jgi:predicted HAD superfamily Cof-like phosphohydrolase
MQASEMLRQFHTTYGLTLSETPNSPAPELVKLRMNLIEEEVEELREAIGTFGELVEVADALADIVYIAFGTALVYGIDLDAVLNEVHRSNMSKLGEDGKPIYREDGKVLKGPNYSPPDIKSILEKK